MKGLRQLLSAVSRSFYLSMRFLPREMRPGVAVGYLLARATDTVADTVDMDCRERLALLRMMGATVAGDASREAAASCFGRLGILSTVQTHRGEAELLARFPECLALLEALSPREQMLVRQVLSTIVEGQAWDLEYFEARSSVSCPEQLEHYTYMVAGCVGEFWTRLGLLALGSGFSTQPEDQLLRWGRHYGMGQAWDLEYFEARSSVSCPEQLEHYTYMVAGCVGEFWTRLGLLALGSGFSTQPEDQLLRWGRHYGMGLQLVNILRDREEDLSRGRSYLPTPDVQPWLDRAERWLKEGVFYAESLRNGRLRFSTVLPAWLGLDTLELLQRQEQPGTGKVKITRGNVYSRMWKAFLFSWKEAL